MRPHTPRNYDLTRLGQQATVKTKLVPFLKRKTHLRFKCLFIGLNKDFAYSDILTDRL